MDVDTSFNSPAPVTALLSPEMTSPGNLTAVVVAVVVVVEEVEVVEVVVVVAVAVVVVVVVVVGGTD